MKKKKKISIFLFFVFLSGFILNSALAQKIPENIPELEEAGKEALEVSPGIMEEIWQGFIGFLKNLLKKIKYFWETYLWDYLKDFLNREVEQRKPVIQQEFEKEKEELKTELPSATKSIWQRLKELIR